MADDSQQPDQPTSIEQDNAVAWRNEQFRRAKMAMRGLQAADFGSGGGEFIEPVQSGQPIPQLYPEDQQLLAMATGTQIVSGTPELAGSYDPPEIVPESAPVSIQESAVPSFDMGHGSDVQVGSATVQAPTVQDPGLQDFGINLPSSEAPLETFESPATMSPSDASRPPETAEIPGINEPAIADISPPPEAVDAGLPEPKPLWPPGAGKQATEEMLQQQKLLNTTGPQPKPSSERPNAQRPPMFIDRGPVDMPEIDWGTAGDLFGESPDATQTAHQDAMKAATDSIGMAGEMLIAVLNQMTSVLIKVSDGLENIKDRLDAQDESDEW